MQRDVVACSDIDQVVAERPCKAQLADCGWSEVSTTELRDYPLLYDWGTQIECSFRIQDSIGRRRNGMIMGHDAGNIIPPCGSV
jgi:hypothetical protein